mmetsp:Transcript_64843/g.154820  ORF Transcript_64843/g.154820 Transcript_64843/m.154820 type:complete len:148 (-) Transcript_64843:341-784(-)
MADVLANMEYVVIDLDLLSDDEDDAQAESGKWQKANEKGRSPVEHINSAGSLSVGYPSASGSCIKPASSLGGSSTKSSDEATVDLSTVSKQVTFGNTQVEYYDVTGHMDNATTMRMLGLRQHANSTNNIGRIIRTPGSIMPRLTSPF